jgi:hypothetical protein
VAISCPAWPLRLKQESLQEGELHTYKDPISGGIYRFSTRRQSIVYIKNLHGLSLDGERRLNLSLKIPKMVGLLEIGPSERNEALIEPYPDSRLVNSFWP